MAEEIQEYTKQILEQLGMNEGGYPDDHKIYHIDFGNNLIVRYNDLDPGVYFNSDLVVLESKNREAFLMSLMHLNLFGRGAQGAVFGYDEGIKQLTLSLAVPYRLKFKEFKNILEDFVNYIEFWKTELTKAQMGQKSVLND